VCVMEMHATAGRAESQDGSVTAGSVSVLQSRDRGVAVITFIPDQIWIRPAGD